MASVRDRALIGKHDTVGRSYICLDPRRYGDFLAHDMFLDLDTQGRLLLRISMEGEKDDIVSEFKGDAKTFLEQAMSGPTKFTLTDEDERRTSVVEIEARYVPVDIKLEPRESINSKSESVWLLCMFLTISLRPRYITR